MSFYKAPVFNLDTQEWSYREFQTKGDTIRYVYSQFKYPGQYGLKHATKVWDAPGRFFEANGYYCKHPKNSIDFRKYWDFEKEKSYTHGFIIYVSEEEGYEQMLPSLYYWYLNFTPIYDKVKKSLTIPAIWDGDLHTYMALLLCLLTGYHFVCLKKRQFGMSLKLTSVLINHLWFGEASRVKMFSYSIVHTENSWLFLEQYRDHINKHCGWVRGFDPNQMLNWQVRRRKNDGTYVGNLSVLKGLSTERDASKPVGGGITIAFGEEAGINPSLDSTHEYALPAVGLGGLTTGLLMYSGSVGELDKCEPLRKFMSNPENNGFLHFDNLCPGDEDLGNKVGFFVPEWWNYISIDPVTMEKIECFDENGNTDKERALTLIEADRVKAREKDPSAYRHYCSQRPLSINEAFAYRKESIFPQALLSRQEYRIERGDYKYKTYDIERGGDGTPIFVKAKHPEIENFPFNPKKDEIPYGCIKVWEDPDPSLKFGTYFAAVDPISVDKTSTSESLFSVVIYKNIIEVKYEEDGVVKTRLERDKIVASYIGRKENIQKSNELGELLIEKYNAFAVVENNVDNFIKHMIAKHKQKYLAMKSDLPFLKELNTNNESYQDYGVRTNPMMWTHYINKILEYLKEEMDAEYKSDGQLLRISMGIERIPDRRIIKELMAFTSEKGNYDQIVTLGLVIALAKSRQANGLISKKEETMNTTADKNMYNVHKTPFRSGTRIRTPFKNVK